MRIRNNSKSKGYWVQYNKGNAVFLDVGMNTEIPSYDKQLNAHIERAIAAKELTVLHDKETPYDRYDTDTRSLEELRAEYERLAGTSPHKNYGRNRLSTFIKKMKVNLED